jgi:DNA recombination protein RmuC
MSIALALVAGAVLGGFAVLFMLRSRLQERDRYRDGLLRAERELIGAEARLETAEATFDERLTHAIKVVSAEALKENAAAFADQAMGRLDQFVKPLKESLDKVETNVQTLEERRQRAYGALHKEVELLRQSSDGLRAQTGNLTVALRGNPQTRGQWGEIQLRRVIEIAGMLRHCDFAEQQTMVDSDGHQLRPDVIVRLPGAKCIVIDAKVSLVAYLEAHREELSDEERLARLKTHADQVRRHIQQLAQKAYWRELPETPDFVVMFMHNETSWTAALDQDPGLQELAFSNNVIPATPTNLIGLLRAVHYGWQQEAIAEGAREISDLGRELYKRIATMGAHVSKVGRALDGAVKAYNETVGSLERQVLPQARRFQSHGITGIELPELPPVERQTRALASPELAPAEQTESRPELASVDGVHAA